MHRLALHWQIMLGMLIGAAIGLGLNGGFGERQWKSQATDSLPKRIVRASVHDTTDRITIELVREQAEAGGATRKVTETIVVDPTGKTEGSVAAVSVLAKKSPEAHEVLRRYGRSWARWAGDLSKRLGGLFLRLLRMVSIPLIVTSLTSGVMGLGSAARLGRMFAMTLAYYLSTSLLAILTGLALVNLINPGLKSDAQPKLPAVEETAKPLSEVMFDQIETLIPANPFGSLADGTFLSVISFSVAFAIFALMRGGDTARRVKELADAGFDVMMAMTMAIIKLAPLGVLFLMLYVTASQGIEVFQSLFWYMVTVLAALVIHACVVLPLILKFVARRNPWEFAQAMSPALLTAFSSASSNATLPLTIASVENRAGVSNRVSSFVLPLGATVNMDGTALYEAVAVLFIAQLYHGEALPMTQQIVVAMTALLASIGAAGIPHAGLVMMVIILNAVGLPPDMQGIILAVDRVLDMCRTSVNVWSDSCGCAVIARFEDADAKAAA